MNITTRLRHGRYYRASSTAPLPLGQVLTGDAETVLRTLPAASIDSVITSPPYHLLRRYHAGPSEIGTDADVEDYVDRLVAVCDEIARVLTPGGGLWLNLGDSFSRGPRYGAAAKALVLAPERLLLRLMAHGWRTRNKIVWAKPNPMPGPQTDRLSTTWEPLFYLVRSPHYFFDLDVIREPHRSRRSPRSPTPGAKYDATRPTWAGPLAGANDGLARCRKEGRPGHPLGKNPGDVWTIATAGFRGAHFAVFPEELIRRPLLAGCPARVCTGCARPWQRAKRRDRLGDLRPGCRCGPTWRPGRVLDPFMGAGTVALAAERHGRDWLGIELNPAFAAMSQARIAAFRQRRE